MWVCASIKPGSKVAPGSSTTRAPGGPSTSPAGPTRWLDALAPHEHDPALVHHVAVPVEHPRRPDQHAPLAFRGGWGRPGLPFQRHDTDGEHTQDHERDADHDRPRCELSLEIAPSDTIYPGDFATTAQARSSLRKRPGITSRHAVRLPCVPLALPVRIEPIQSVHWQSQWHTGSEPGSYSQPVPQLVDPFRGGACVRPRDSSRARNKRLDIPEILDVLSRWRITDPFGSFGVNNGGYSSPCAGAGTRRA